MPAAATAFASECRQPPPPSPLPCPLTLTEAHSFRLFSIRVLWWLKSYGCLVQWDAKQCSMARVTARWARPLGRSLILMEKGVLLVPASSIITPWTHRGAVGTQVGGAGVVQAAGRWRRSRRSAGGGAVEA